MKRYPVSGGAAATVATIDVAHPPLSSDDAERLLDDSVRAAGLSGGVRVLKIIHGYGSGGRGGTLRTTVRNWAFRRKTKLALVLPGEEYSPFNPEVQRLLAARGLSPAGLGPADPGFTLIFIL